MILLSSPLTLPLPNRWIIGAWHDMVKESLLQTTVKRFDASYNNILECPLYPPMVIEN